MTDKEIAALQEELFCIRYEMEMLASQITGNCLERWISGYTPVGVEQEHVQRYEYASQLTYNKKVLDFACGTGAGTSILADAGRASEVFAYDIDPKSILYCRIRNSRPQVQYQVMDTSNFCSKSEFDVVVSFETIEHVPQPELFLSRVAAALVPGGLLLISTPVGVTDVDLAPANPHHLCEWGVSAFRELLERHFRIRKHFLQYRPYTVEPFWRRVARRIVGAKTVQIRNVIRPPCWQELDERIRAGQLPKFSLAYQIVECVRR